MTFHFADLINLTLAIDNYKTTFIRLCSLIATIESIDFTPFYKTTHTNTKKNNKTQKEEEANCIIRKQTIVKLNKGRIQNTI